MIRTKEYLKERFGVIGYIPTPDDFIDLIDTYRSLGEYVPAYDVSGLPLTVKTATTSTDPNPVNPAIIWEVTEGTYTNFLDENDDPIVVDAEQLAHLIYNGEYFEKIIVPISEAAIAAVNETINGTTQVKGAVDALSTYTSALTSTFVRCNNTPFTVAGTLDYIEFWCVLAGTATIKLWKDNGNGTHALVENFVFTAVLGLNTFTAGVHFRNDIEVQPGYLLSSYKTSTSATIGFKNKTNEVLFTTAQGIDGLPVTFSSISTYEIALKGGVKTVSINGNIDTGKTSTIGLKARVGETKVYNDMSSLGAWIAEVGAPTLSVASGEMHIVFTAGANQSISLRNVLKFGQKYKVRFRAKRISGTINALRVGFFGSGAATADNFDINVTSDYQEFTGIVTPTFNRTVAHVSIGALIANNTGGEIVIDDFELSIEGTLEQSIKALDTKIVGITGETYLLDEFAAIGSWNGTGGASAIASAGIMTITYTTGAQTVGIDNVLTFGKPYDVAIRIRRKSGSILKLRIGVYTSTTNVTDYFDIAFTGSDWVTYEGTITTTINASIKRLSIGVLSGDNSGGEFEIEFVKLYKKGLVEQQIDAIELPDSGGGDGVAMPAPIMFNTQEVFCSLSKTDKKLTKIAVVGDSIMANAVGGAIPVEYDEGIDKRPQRLSVNTFARKLYDLLSWNKATHRNINSSDWTKTGTWTDIRSQVYEPIYDSSFADRYLGCADASAYVEITVPDGKENFAVVLRKHAGYGSFSVTLNGSDISAYGLATIDLQRPNAGSEHTGNPYYIVEYTDLPAGDNVIRLTKSNDALPVGMWGGFYWSGNTLMIQNIAHGGHTFNELITEHLNAEFVENKFDAVVFSLPVMNEMGTTQNFDVSKASMIYILENVTKDMDALYLTVHPYGTDPTDDTPNYYEMYPDMDVLNGILVQELYNRGLPCVDIFRAIKRWVVANGGTLENGDAGRWLTGDGQHQNTKGGDKRFSICRPVFINNPLRE